MVNTKLVKIINPDKKLLQYAGLSSIQTDLSFVKTIIGILLKQMEKASTPKDMESLVTNDALYTAIFIKYRRCFNSAKRNAGLNIQHVPNKFHKLHEDMIRKANYFYAHAFDHQAEVTYQIETETNEVRGLSSTVTLDVYPLDEKSLKNLKMLIEGLENLVFEKQKKINSSNKSLQLTGVRA